MKKLPAVGDTVVVRTIMPDWPGYWCSPEMDGRLGKLSKVLAVGNSYGGQVRLQTGRRNFQTCWFPLECLGADNLDLTKKIKLRGKKGKLHAIRKVKSKKHPIQADVTIGRHKLTLNYGPDGQFYPGFDQPIDLVNK